MAKRPTINTLTNTASPTYLTQLNQNFSNIQAQFDNTLSLDGSLPNAMNADLDLNDFDLINAGTVNADNLVVAGTNLNSVVGQAAASATAAATSASAAAASATTASAYTPAYFDNVAALLADTRAWPTGQILNTREEGFAYEVAASGASNHHITTAGGVKLYVLVGSDGVINILSTGAVGDWNGTTGTDNRAAILAAISAIPATGGVLLIAPSSSGACDYLVSNSISIARSNIEVRILPGTTLRCVTNTTDGHTIAFIGATGTQLENVGFTGGGTVRNTAPGTNENAIGFARCKNYYCIGMNVPQANKKGITAQVNCDNGRVLFNNVGTTGDSGIAIEGDSVGEGTANDRLELVGNTVLSATGTGINITRVTSPNFTNVVSKDNRVVSATGVGFAYSGIENLVESGNSCEFSGSNSFNYINVTKARIVSPRSKDAAIRGMGFNACGEVTVVAPDISGASRGSSNVYDAILVDSPVGNITFVAPIVRGTEHKLAIGTLSMGAFSVRVVSPDLTPGVSGTYGPIASIDIIERTDGGRKTQVIPYAASITPNYLNGSLVFVGQLTGNITLNAPTNAKSGQSILVRFVQNGAGGNTISFGANIKFTGSITTTGNTVTLLEFDFDGSNWRGSIRYTGQAI